jgi:hypothetical protein
LLRGCLAPQTAVRGIPDAPYFYRRQFRDEADGRCDDIAVSGWSDELLK